MTEELSKRDIESLAEKNVGMLKEVQEAVCLLMAIAPAMKRARRSCSVEARVNLLKFMKDSNNSESDKTIDAMCLADEKFRRIIEHTEELTRYI